MLVNKIVPVEIHDRICVHCDDTDEKDPITYLIAEKGQGKTTETIRQAVFRRNIILSTEYEYYKTRGMKRVDEAAPGEICFMGLRDIFDENFQLTNVDGNEDQIVELCVDNGKTILEQLLSKRFNRKIKIKFMSLEA